MSFPLVVANLHHQEDLPATLGFEYISISKSWQNQDVDPTVQFYELCDGRIEMDTSSPTYLKHLKAIAKARVASTVLTQLFANHSGIDLKTDESDLPSVCLGDTMIIADEAFVEGDAVATHSWNLFLSVRFTFPLAVNGRTVDRLASTQHLQVSSPTLKLDDGLFQRCEGSFLDHIEIVTGMCIFNDHILNTSLAKSGSSKVNADYLALSPVSFHELDYIARCSSTVADMAAMFLVRRGPEQTESIGIRLDVPSFHYYPSVVRAYECGKSTTSEAIRWMDAVDRRHDQICSVFIRAIKYELRKRGIDSNNLVIRVSPRKNPFATATRHGTQTGQIPSLQDILQHLKYWDNHLWQEFFALIPERELPQDLEGLAYLFYVFASVESALSKSTATPMTTLHHGETDHTVGGIESKKRYNQSRTENICHRLILSVDEAVERRIYSRAQEVLRKLRSARQDLPTPMLVESYMCRRVYVNGNKARARLYRCETAPQPIRRRDARCVSNNDVNNAQLVEPLDVVRELYGDSCAYNLQTWLADVGLALHARSDKASL